MVEDKGLSLPCNKKVLNEKKELMKMKLGIIGSGLIVQEFLHVLLEMEGLEVIGIQGTSRSLPNIKEMQAQFGLKVGTDKFDELCDAGIDTVYVAVPNHLHFDYCVQALKRGLNVICEKPMTSNIEEARTLALLAKEKERFLFEAITTLYLGNYLKIKEWLNRIGEIKLVQSQYSQYSRRYDAFLRDEILPVFDTAKSGGALMDLNLYNLHYVLGLFGKPEKSVYFANVEKGIDTSGVLVLNYPGFVATCVAAKDSKGIFGGIIQGTKGCIRSALPPNVVGEVVLELNDGTREVYDDGMGKLRMIPEFQCFIKAINNNDLAFCYQQLDKSLAVCEVQTNSRRKAGIYFAADKEKEYA